MPTQEERIIRLEQITSEYRPALSGFAHELTIVKGLIIDQIRISNGMKQDISGMKLDIDGLKQDMTSVKQDIIGLKQDSSETKERLTTIEGQLRQVLVLLRQS